MELELKHLAPYLPYKLKVKSIDIFRGNPVFEMGMESKNNGNKYASIRWVLEDDFKPILRPLSGLTKEIEVNGGKFVPLEILNKINFNINKEWIDNGIENLPYYIIEKLFEWHFDIFGLIEKELAVDINTLNK